MANNPSISVEKLKGYEGKMEPFEEDAQLFFSTFEYDKTKTSRRAPSLSNDEQAWYAGLGCLGDFTDDLLSFAFDRQVAVDLANAPYYYDCLNHIATRRNSEQLEMKIAMLASEGYYGRQDVVKAHRYFMLDTTQSYELTDQYILNV